MGDRVLITGGAGFIGSHLADELLRLGYRVRVLDDLSPQVHGNGEAPSYLSDAVELVVGDVRDRDAVRGALLGVDYVYHLAARVGVGQSMYRIEEYVSVNDTGTAVLLEELIDAKVQRLIVASSMSIYGEGHYRNVDGHTVEPPFRSLEQLRRGNWEILGPDTEPLVPVPTTEWKAPALESVYALSKFDQERLCLVVGRAYGIPTVALRFFNVYGPRQALSNPYTGVLAIFASRLLNGKRPLIFEDGRQRRDFVSVHDVARASAIALTAPGIAGQVVNVGSGVARSVAEVARDMAGAMGKDLPPEISGRYRQGDIRHCFADITRMRELLNYEPKTSWEAGIAELMQWLGGQVAKDAVIEARAELEARGLTL